MLPLAPGATIGILGGGQLGRMLALAAARLGFRCHIYAPAGDNPAFEVAARALVLEVGAGRDRDVGEHGGLGLGPVHGGQELDPAEVGGGGVVAHGVLTDDQDALDGAAA